MTLLGSDVLWTAGIALAALAVSWSVGWSFARWGRGPALFVRVLACGPIGLVAVGYAGIGSPHWLPVEFLYVPAALYPLIACEADRAVGLRVLVLGELSAMVVSQAMSLALWWNGHGLPAAVGIVQLAVMVAVVPVAALRAQAHHDVRRGLF